MLAEQTVNVSRETPEQKGPRRGDRGEDRLIEGPRGLGTKSPLLQFCKYTGTPIPSPYPKVPIAPLANRLSIGISL